MSRAGTITRRTLLVGSAVIAGGVAFGVYAVSTPHANPLEDEVGPTGATFNPWVMITPEKIVLIAPHADLGQGAAGMQSLLIAEEMDLEPGGYEIGFGPPSAAYWNRAQGDESAPFMSQDDSIVAEGVRGAMTSLFKVLGMQITGGSSSTPDSFDKLREAGAIARETLKAAAAKKHDVDVAGLKTENGSVILPDGTAIPYTDLAEDAAKIEPVTGVALRDPSKWRLIGKDVRRPDIVAKSTGALRYGIDLKLDNMVYATVKLSPRRGALNGFDAANAETMRGVSKVMEITDGVAVVADNTWRAFKAAEAITLDWAPSEYPAEQDGHWEKIASSFTSGSLDAEWRNDGEVDTGLAEGGVDILWLETLSALNVLEAGVRGVRKVTDLPIVATMSYDTAGRTMMGVTGTAQGEMIAALGLDAAGANCGATIPDTEAAVALIHAAGGGIPVVSKANAGIPVWHGAELHYDGTPDVLAAHAVRVHDAGASLIGACCGSGPEHIEMIARVLSGELPVPDVEAPVHVSTSKPAPQRERRRRRSHS